MNNDFSELIEYLDGKFQKIDTQLAELPKMHGQIAQLPTKAYLDDKLANLEGGLVAKLRKEDEKVNMLAAMLKEKKVLTDSDIKELGQLQVFPK